MFLGMVLSVCPEPELNPSCTVRALREKGIMHVCWLIPRLLHRVKPSISKWSNQSAICV